jgi:hypothetical protein
MPLPPAIPIAIGATALTLRSGQTGIRRPAWNTAPFYALPLLATRCRRIGMNQPLWSEAVSVEGKSHYVGVVTHFAVAAEVPLEGSGVEFRLMHDGNPMPYVTLPQDAEICRDLANILWPCFKRPLQQIVAFQSKLTIEVRNISASGHRYYVGLFGYFYPDTDPATYVGERGGRRNG